MLSLDDTSEVVYTESQLNAMTKAELLVLANKLGIEGLTEKTLKADMISAILNR